MKRIKLFSIPVDHPIENDFYQIPQFQRQPLNNNDIDDEHQQTLLERRSKNIDTSFICAILFWMITSYEPEVFRAQTGEALHQLPEYRPID